MNNIPSKIMVVIDPTRDSHYALNRIIEISRVQKEEQDLELKFFVAIDGQAVDTSAKNPSMYRDSDWFFTVMDQLGKSGVNYSAQICWSPEWVDSILEAAKQFGAELISVPDYSKKTLRNRLTDAKWDLLRRAECPVAVIRPAEDNQFGGPVLVSVKAQDDSSAYQEMNRKLLDQGARLASLYGNELHVVNSYSDSMHYPDRAQILKLVDIAPENIHITQGAPDEVIPALADELSAGLVVIGTMKRTGLKAAMRGNTSESVMSRTNKDILTIN
jgi:universal stress protein E